MHYKMMPVQFCTFLVQLNILLIIIYNIICHTSCSSTLILYISRKYVNICITLCQFCISPDSYINAILSMLPPNSMLPLYFQSFEKNHSRIVSPCRSIYAFIIIFRIFYHCSKISAQ